MKPGPRGQLSEDALIRAYGLEPDDLVPPGPCPEPGCDRLTRAGYSRCDGHAAALLRRAYATTAELDDDDLAPIRRYQDVER
jgi:hypothetical protein